MRVLAPNSLEQGVSPSEVHRIALVEVRFRLPGYDRGEQKDHVGATAGEFRRDVRGGEVEGFGLDRKRRFEAGMDGAVPKPFDMQVLFHMIESHSTGGSQVVAAAPAAAPGPSAPASETVAAHLQRTTGGNEKLIRSLVESFLADAPKKLSNIRRAVSKKDAAKLASAAHAFKGAAAIFGAANTVAAARNLEAMGKAGNLAGAEKEFRTLEDEFARLEGELGALASNKKQEAPARRKK